MIPAGKELSCLLISTQFLLFWALPFIRDGTIWISNSFPQRQPCRWSNTVAGTFTLSPGLCVPTKSRHTAVETTWPKSWPASFDGNKDGLLDKKRDFQPQLNRYGRNQSNAMNWFCVLVCTFRSIYSLFSVVFPNKCRQSGFTILKRSRSCVYLRLWRWEGAGPPKEEELIPGITEQEGSVRFQSTVPLCVTDWASPWRSKSPRQGPFFQRLILPGSGDAEKDRAPPTPRY